MFGKCRYLHGDLVIPKRVADRWHRQANTPYCELSVTEQNSDRTEADKFIVIFEQVSKANK